MISTVFQRGLLGFIRLLTTTLVAGWGGSPMSWSSDSQWLGYTVAPGSSRDDREPGWLFDTSRDGPVASKRSDPSNPPGPSSPAPYRIWTTHRDSESSVTIEESAWPLTSPSWSPQGRSLAFGRFVPASMELNQADPHGRIEIVIQNGLQRKQTTLTVSNFELDPEARSEFPDVAPAWSPDGQYLAFPRPGRDPAILILKVERAETAADDRECRAARLVSRRLEAGLRPGRTSGREEPSRGRLPRPEIHGLSAADRRQPDQGDAILDRRGAVDLRRRGEVQRVTDAGTGSGAILPRDQRELAGLVVRLGRRDTPRRPDPRPRHRFRSPAGAMLLRGGRRGP